MQTPSAGLWGRDTTMGMVKFSFGFQLDTSFNQTAQPLPNNRSRNHCEEVAVVLDGGNSTEESNTLEVQ